MVAVRARPPDGQLQVDLRRDADGDRAARHGDATSTRRRRCRPWRAGPRRSGRTRPRRAARRGPTGRRPAARSTASAAAGVPAQPASAARSVLRRWAKAASTTANTSPAVARRRRRLARGQRDQPGVDVGHRPEHGAADRAGPAHVAVPARLDRRDAVGPRARAGPPAGRRPRPAPSPAPVRSEGSSVQQVQQHRHGDVVGQVRHQRGRRRDRAGRRSTAQRVGGDDLEAVGRASGACSATVAAARRPARGSISTAMTAAAAVEQRQGQRPEPGPDLEHDVVGARRRRRARCGARCSASMTKFCPRFLVGRQAEAARRARAPRAGAEQRGTRAAHARPRWSEELAAVRPRRRHRRAAGSSSFGPVRLLGRRRVDRAARRHRRRARRRARTGRAPKYVPPPPTARGLPPDSQLASAAQFSASTDVAG